MTYRKTFYIPLTNDINPSIAECQVLSYRQTLDIYSPENTSRVITNMLILAGVKLVHNVLDDEGNILSLTPDKILPYLTENQKHNIANLITQKSKIQMEQYQGLNLGLDIVYDDKYQDDSWKCDVCKLKNMHKARNCPFENFPQDKRIKYYIKGKLFNTCPIGSYDRHLVADAYECFKAWEQGVLIEAGGLYDQTEFFVIASQLVKAKQNEYQSKKLEESKRKK
jgi:hypothetical protein